MYIVDQNIDWSSFFSCRNDGLVDSFVVAHVRSAV